MKRTLLALSACSIAILPAQTTAPEKPAAKTEKAEKAEKAEELKAETPVEKMAFEIFDIVAALPEILGKVKDEATLATAQEEIDGIFTKLKVKETELLKLPVPSNEARIKLSKKMEIKQEVMGQKMAPVMMGIQTLPQEVAMKIMPVMQSFGAKMDALEPTMSKYFKPDEKEDEKGAEKE